MLKIYVCDDQMQAATLINKWGRDKLIDTGSNPVLDAVMIARDATGAESTIRNYTGENKHILVFRT